MSDDDLIRRRVVKALIADYQVYYKYSGDRASNDMLADIDSISAALAELDAARAVTVKPLVWREEQHRGWRRGLCYSQSVGGLFYIQRGDECEWQYDGRSFKTATIDEALTLAKAAAQADYTARIRSALAQGDGK